MGKNKIVIVGGGASGLIAGIIGAKNGASVTILERKDRIGKKILATGNGRCNISNNHAEQLRYHSSGDYRELVAHVLEKFSVQDTIDFFESIGLLIIEKDEGKLYPRCLQASAVVNVLLKELERLKVNIVCSAEVKDIKVDKNIKVLTKDNTYYCNKVIIAAGGKSCPDLGSNGSGFELAKKLGHHIMPVFPSLVQLKTDCPYLKHLKGTKLDANLVITDENDVVLREEFGEVLFTDYGISGPPVLQLSRIGALRLVKGQDAYISIDIMSDFTDEELEGILLDRFSHMPTKTAEEGMVGLINSRLIVPILKAADITLSKKLTDITKIERKNLVNILKCFKMKVTGTNQWNQSQVTAGGVDISEVDGQSLKSKIVKGIYFCGEVMDIDGDCGGYNLQWAFSTGAIAGMSASKGD